MVEVRDGGTSWFAFANNYKLQTPTDVWVPDATDAAHNPVLEILEDLVANAAKYPDVRRQFVRYDFDIDGSISQSEAIRASRGRAKGQADQMWGSGPIETELYMDHMVDYVQLILNADPNTISTDTVGATLTASGTIVNLKATTTEITFSKGGTADAATNKINTAEPHAQRVPGKLTITIAHRALVGKSMTIQGYRKSGWLEPYDAVPQTEVVTFKAHPDASNTTDAVATTKKSYYLPYTDSAKTATFPMKLIIAGTTVQANKTLTIKSVPKTKRTVFQSREDIGTGATFIANVGGVPRLAWGAVPQRATFRASNPIRLTMEMLSRGMWRRRMPGSGFLQEVLNIPKTYDVNETDSYFEQYPFIKNTLFPHYGRVLIFDDNSDVVIFRDAEITIDQGLDFLEGSTGSKTRLPIEGTDAGRNITATLNVYYESGDAATDDFIRWDERFRDNITSPVDLYTYYWDTEGVERYHKLRMAEAELTAVPRVPVDGKGALNESLSVAGVEEGASKDIEWTIVDDTGWNAPSFANKTTYTP